VGVDVGLRHFATLSTGKHIDNPRFFRTDERALAKAQRRLSAVPKGTPERIERRKVVARIHERIANRRREFAHQESRKLVSAFGLIVFEALLIRDMLKQHTLAKAIADAAWSQLVRYTTYRRQALVVVSCWSIHATPRRIVRAAGIASESPWLNGCIVVLSAGSSSIAMSTRPAIFWLWDCRAGALAPEADGFSRGSSHRRFNVAEGIFSRLSSIGRFLGHLQLIVE
jgi:hypothetical protein